MRLVASHLPGEDDDALGTVAGWPNARLKELWVDANVLTQMTRHADAERFTVRGEGQRTATAVRYSKSDLQRLRVLACVAGGVLFEPPCMAMAATNELDPELRQIASLSRAARSRGDGNYIQRRGALLHSDVAILAPGSMVAPGGVGPPGGGLERLRLEISDGGDRSPPVGCALRSRGCCSTSSSPGRTRLAPGRDDMVRQWYRATASWMQLREDRQGAPRSRAPALPSDGHLFLSACQRDDAGAPSDCGAVGGAADRRPWTSDPSASSCARRKLFRRLLEIKLTTPRAAALRARARRAGKLAESAVELRRAIADLADRRCVPRRPLPRRLGRRSATATPRASPTNSPPLFPMAQSCCCWRSASRRGATAMRQRARDRSALRPSRGRPRQKDDPWWWLRGAGARR